MPCPAPRVALAAVASRFAACAAVALLSQASRAQPTLNVELLAKAQPDECYAGIGQPYPQGAPNCPEGSTPKVSGSYVWSLIKAGDRLWFGTVKNIFCQSRGLNFEETEPFETHGLVCEFGESAFAAENPGLPPPLGDWRPPAIYTYDLAAAPESALVERSANLPFMDRIRLNTTVGFRSAAAHNNVVFLAGTSLYGRVNLFAFRADTGTLIGSTTLQPFDAVRQWRVENGVLYVGVSLRGAGGVILRWTGSVSDPFRFTAVGNLDAFPANLAVHQGRLFVTTWPTVGANRVPAGVWISPRIPPGGLNALHANRWTEVWRFEEYEPDPIVASTYGGGAIASYGDWAYWGSMHIPQAAQVEWAEVYGEPQTPEQERMVSEGTLRAVSIFRGRVNDVGEFETQLLYGDDMLPVYDAVQNVFVPTPNGMGSALFGPSGFGNKLNNYTWSMLVHNNRLFVGIGDQSYLTYDRAEILGQNPVLLWILLSPYFGGDLWRFEDADTPAVPEDLHGLGNYTNWGVRTLIADGDTIYAGTANPMSLLTDPTDNIPEGGWELLRLTPIDGAP
jgi:hypothetical protein